jgi:ribosome maturation factor RimP
MELGLERVRGIVERVAASSGLELVEVDLRGGGKSRMLRITIDKPGGVTHEDCAHLSREVGTILDVEDAVPGGSYLLEVSSPGLDRPLMRATDFERFTGSLVKLTTREAVNGSQHFEGRLEGFHGGRITLTLGGPPVSNRHKKPKAGAPEPARVEIDLANVTKANLVPEF